MKPIIKYWKSSLQKLQLQKSRQVTTANDCLKLKIRMEEIQLKAAFERESRFFLAEFQRPDCVNTTNCDEYIYEMMHHHLDVLFANCVKNYIHFCVLHYFSALDLPQAALTKSFLKFPIDLDKVKEDITDIIINFYASKNSFEEYMTQRIEDRKETITKVAEYIQSGWKQLVDYGNQLQVKGKLINIALSGRAQYTYICENADSSCDTCRNLNGRIFRIGEAEMGTNLPPMHPNCKCSISAYPALTELPEVPEWMQDSPVEFLMGLVESAIQRAEGRIEDLVEKIEAIWNFFFKEALEDTYGTYTSIWIDGKKYRINMASFGAVVIMPDGNYLVPELVSDVDKQMLAIMKERDSLTEGDQRIDELNEKLQGLYDSADENERHVYWKKPYSFYFFGGDVTERLTEYMKNSCSNYAEMHDLYWAENLSEFYRLVRNRGEMDLKNQSEWQNSAFIFDGEIVSQDALGNINYGYFGKHCNFPDLVLIAAGGAAQVLAGTSNVENWQVFFDDPRDSYRVMQGIEIYEKDD